MPIYSSNNQKVFHLFNFDKENEFEKVVVKLSDLIFGENSIYFDIKRKVAGDEITSIPDGYLLEFADVNQPRLYIVENEIVSHDPFKHVGSQLLRFVVSFEEAQVKIWDILMEQITSRPEIKKRLESESSKSQFRNIDDFLSHAVYQDFSGLVVIDEIRPELTKVIEKINANISVIQLKTYKSDDGEFSYEYNTLYEEDEDASESRVVPLNADERKKHIERRAKCDTIIVPAKAEGFKKVFLGENRWYAIRIGAAMKDKIKYVACYQVAPISAVTHIAEVKEIRPYKETGKYQIIFVSPAVELDQKRLVDVKKKPQGPVYAQYSKLVSAKSLDEAIA